MAKTPEKPDAAETAQRLKAGNTETPTRHQDEPKADEHRQANRTTDTQQNRRQHKGRMVFKPTSDIGTTELHSALEACNLEVDQSAFDKLPAHIQRHFQAPE